MNNINADDLGRNHDITIDEVKALPTFAHFSDENAQEVVETIKLLAIIILKYHEKNEDRTL